MPGLSSAPYQDRRPPNLGLSRPSGVCAPAHYGTMVVVGHTRAVAISVGHSECYVVSGKSLLGGHRQRPSCYLIVRGRPKLLIVFWLSGRFRGTIAGGVCLP